MVTCVEVFNKVFIALLKDLRKNANLKKVISKGYPAFHHDSDAYFNEFKSVGEKLFPVLCDDFSGVAEIADVEFVRGVTFKQVFDVCNEEKDTINKYLFTLLLVWLVDSRDDLEIHAIITKLTAIEHDPSSTDISDIFDEDVSRLLQMIASRTKVDENTIPGIEDLIDGNPDDIMNMLSNSKIGNMAKEIADDLATASEDDSKDMAKMIGRVTEKIGSKLQNGEITQTDLMNEAMQMMSKLKPSGDLMKNVSHLMKNMQNMKHGMSNPKRSGATRERLKQRLALKN